MFAFFAAILSLIYLVNSQAIPNPLALPVPDEDDSLYECHAACAAVCMGAYQCSPNKNTTSDLDVDCLKSKTEFIDRIPACLDCGWCIWDQGYGILMTSALELVGSATTPTGTSCATKSDSYYALASKVAVNGGIIDHGMVEGEEDGHEHGEEHDDELATKSFDEEVLSTVSISYPVLAEALIRDAMAGEEAEAESFP
ncbi:unnamed protein product [Ambrosiozyma monospora]|uniref:Unnamed protein product n=1 Tax=Ambrosiozyma monospora TaxID=43982 RepID=A0ACB5T485_AMBMO|nr:unnamed protein product [Ambrosiozyma monospora]